MKRRTSHILKPNMKSEYPRNILFFDTETTEKPEDEETELVLKLGSACFWRREHSHNKERKIWRDFTTPEQFWSFVDECVDQKQKIYLVAHNVSFDFRVLKGFDYMRNNGFITRKLIYNGTSNIWEFRKGTITISVLDNMNFFKSSLKILGDSIGVPKLEMPTDDDVKLLEYCRNDVQVMIRAWEILFTFLKENDLGNFSKTIASQALSSYRHRFMKTPIYIHTWEHAIKLERESYHGGRTECFFIGQGTHPPYYLLDVNSMYPSVMRELEYPTKIIGSAVGCSISEMQALLQEFCVTARVVLDTREPVFCTKKNNRLIFPVGRFETVLTTRELIYALENSYIAEIQDYCTYEKGILFKNYVDFFYNKRLEYKKTNNEAFNYICKLFLNSLYGKFGQRNEFYETIQEDANAEDGIFEYYDINQERYVKERRINGKIERSTGLKEGYDSFVAIAAHITADARMKLWQYFKLAGTENVFYCDTDSMIVNTQGYTNSQAFIKKDLGALSLKESSDKMIIKGAKDYEFGDEVVIKGIRKDAVQLGEGEYQQVRFEGLAGAIRNQRTTKMYISKTTKKLKRVYLKGKVSSSGKVIPHRLDYSHQGNLFDD